MSRLFLLSPARCDGLRARQLTAPSSSSEMARALREPAGVPIGRVFELLSALYFRGKLAYARAFGDPRLPAGGALVITPCYGLVPADTPIRCAELAALGEVDIEGGDPRYLEPLERDLRTLAEALPPETVPVLLGSISTDKYVAPLVRVLGDRLLFPRELVGRGDMSRGGLLLRAARAGRELEYVPVNGSARRGPRPPRLPSPRGRDARASRPELVVLVGLQGAGKTTLVERRFAKTHVWVSKDRISGRNKERRQREAIEQALLAGRSVVVDNTNATRASRAALIEIGRRLGARVLACYLEISVEEALARNRLRSGKARVPDVAIHATAKRLEPPSLDEGFDEVLRPAETPPSQVETH